jgi:hypothetical protein
MASGIRARCRRRHPSRRRGDAGGEARGVRQYGHLFRRRRGQESTFADDSAVRSIGIAFQRATVWADMVE